MINYYNLIEVTKSELDSLITANELKLGTCYKITDRGDRGITLTAISSNKLSLEGIRTMLCPKTYKLETLDTNIWKGVWHSTKTFAINDLCIWGGLVWKNLTGSVGSATSNREAELDVVNWVVIPKASFTNSEYIEMVFSVHYDYEHDWIAKQFDDNGNEFGCSYEFYNKMGLATIIGSVNPVDLCDYNYTTYGSNVNISNNKAICITNNVEGVTIHGNVVPVGFIRRNKMTGFIINNIIANPSASTSASNVLHSIHDNSCTGNISGNVVSGRIYSNSNTGNILTNFAEDISLNTNGGTINNNNTLGDISINSNTGSIYNNRAYSIVTNSNLGSIYYNSTVLAIQGNLISGDIYNNNVIGGSGGYSIGLNGVNVTDISFNNTRDAILSNNNTGAIQQNRCLYIQSNSGVGNITNNSNNGYIAFIDLNGFNIQDNINNGSISSSPLLANVTDTVVNK